MGTKNFSRKRKDQALMLITGTNKNIHIFKTSIEINIFNDKQLLSCDYCNIIFVNLVNNAMFF